MKLILKYKELINQIIKFTVVGGVAFIIDYSLLYILTEYLDVYYFISSIISFIISLAVNYVLSIKWVFSVNKKQTYEDILLFIFLSVIGLIINQIIMYIGVDILDTYYMITKLIATIIVMIWNFITRKIFVEKK